MRDGQSRWKRVGMDEAGLMELCDEECDSIASSATNLARLPSQRYSVSTGTYLDGQDELWMREAFRKGLGPGKEPQRSYAAREAISLLVKHPHSVFYCHRVATGPLYFASMLCDTSSAPFRRNNPAIPPLPTHRSHSCMAIDGPPPLAIQSPSRWYVRFPPVVTEGDMMTAIQQLQHGIARYLGLRERLIKSAKGNIQDRNNPSSRLNVELYLPSAMLSPRWRPALLEAAKHIRDFRFKVLKAPVARIDEDVWNMLDIKDAPPCEACDWCTADDL